MNDSPRLQIKAWRDHILKRQLIQEERVHNPSRKGGLLQGQGRRLLGGMSTRKDRVDKVNIRDQLQGYSIRLRGTSIRKAPAK